MLRSAFWGRWESLEPGARAVVALPLFPFLFQLIKAVRTIKTKTQTRTHVAKIKGRKAALFAEWALKPHFPLFTIETRKIILNKRY